MSKKFTQKALVGSVASALALVGGAAVASTTNTGPSSTSSINSSSVANAFIPGGVKIVEDGNTLSTTGGFITLKVSNATINNANSAATSINALNSVTTSFAAVSVSGNTLVATVAGASRTILTDISVDGSAAALGSTGVGTTLKLINYNDTSDAAPGTSQPVGRLYYDASNNTVLVLAVKAGTTTGETASVNFASLSPLSANATGAINVTLSDGDAGGFSGVGVSGGTFKLGEFTTTSITGATVATTLPSIPAGSATLQQQGGILIKGVAGASSISNGTSASFEVTLDSGAKWSPNVASSNVSVSGLNGTASIGVLGGGTSKLTIRLDSTTNEHFNSLSRLEIVGGVGTSAALIDVTGVSAGATIKGTVKSLGSMATLNTTVDLATAVASGVTVALKDNAPTGVTVGYTGRSNVSLDDFVTVTEKAAGSISGGTLFTVSLDKGAAFHAGSPLAFTGDNFVGTPSSVTPSTASASVNSSTATDPSNASAGVLTVGTSTNKLILDLTSATAGDVALSVAGAGMTGSVVVAKVQDATSTSASGTLPNIIVDAPSVALPDLIITESAKGALTNSTGIIALQLPLGVTFDNSVVPTVTVTDAAGATQTGVITTPAATHFSGDSRTFGLDPAAAWNSAEKGPFTIKVSGLRVKSSSSASTGAVSLTVGGATNTLPLNGVSDSSTISLSSDAGEKPTKRTVQIGTVAAKDTPIYPIITVADQTKAVITGVPFTPAGVDAGKPGAVYVAAIVGGSVFFMDDKQQFSLFTGASPKPYFEGNIGSTNIDILKTAVDITSLKGAVVLVGYGLGIKGLGDPFQNMLQNVRYSIVYTVR